MNKRKAVVKLNRPRSHREAMIRNLAVGLFEHERIITTRVRGKVLRGFAERLIQRAKKGTVEGITPTESLHHKREVMRTIGQRTIVKKLFEDIAPRFKDRQGGYTRLIHLPERLSDSSKMSIVELVERREKVQRAKSVQKTTEEQSRKEIQQQNRKERQQQKKEKERQKRWYDRIFQTKKRSDSGR